MHSDRQFFDDIVNFLGLLTPKDGFPRAEGRTWTRFLPLMTVFRMLGAELGEGSYP